MTDLPPGFVLDAPQASQQATPQLPEGFVLDQPDEGGGGAFRFIDNIVRSIARGATFGAADEIAAAGNAGVQTIKRLVTGDSGMGVRDLVSGKEAPSFGSDYERNLAQERERDRAFDAEHPVISTGAQIVGGVAGTAVPVSRIPAAATLPGRMVQAAGIGAGTGGAAGFLSGEGGFENRLAEGAKGAGIGAVAGPVLTGVGNAATSAGRVVRNYLTGGNPERSATRLLENALLRDLRGQIPEGQTAADVVAQRIAAARARGVPSNVIDVAGENTRALARSTAAAPGEARNAGLEFVRQRGRDVYNAVDDQLLRAFNPEDFTARRDTLINNLTSGAREAYQQAWEAVPTTRSPVIDKILDTPAGKAAMRAVLDRPAPGQASALGPVTKTAQGDAVETYYTQALHEIKKELWDMGARAKANALTGGDTSESAYLKNLSTRLGNALKEANPAYREAAAQYADEAHLLEALRNGSEQFFRLRPEELRAMVRDLSPTEREMFLTGAYDAIQRRVLDPTRNTANLAAKILDTPGTASRVEAVLGPQRWRAFRERADELSRMFGNTQLVGSRMNSQTTQRAMDVADQENQIAQDLIGAAANVATGGGFGRSVLDFGRRSLSRAVDRSKGINEDSAALLARALLSPSDDALLALTANNARASRMANQSMERQMLARILAAGIPAGAIEATR